MTDDRRPADRMLCRIANALGIETADLWIEGGKHQSNHEVLLILSDFDRIIDQADRTACINFVNAVARQHKIRV